MRDACSRCPRARHRSVLAGGVAVLVAVALLAGPPSAGADTVAVGDAQATLERARAALTELTVELDRAAAAYEHAQAHHLRLAGELAGAWDGARHADEQVATAREQVALRAAEAVRRPDAEMAFGEAVLVAPDPATALHRMALVGRLTRHDPRLEAAEAARDRATDRLHQHRILDAGTAGAAADLQRRGEALVHAVADARSGVEQAEANLAAAEADARRAREAAARTEAPPAGTVPAAAGAGAPAATGPPVPAGGKVCPVGSPHGFIDSWGFPRSGGRWHQGVDVFAPHGTPLFAVADGTILRLTNGRRGGLSVHLLDDAGDRYYYAHLDTFAVEAGQRVVAGDVLGTVGNTGNARTTPPHLHWQVHPANGPAANPYLLARALCRG